MCDGTFFPSLLKEMSEVVGFFNERAQKLLELHLASGFRKYYFWFKGKLQSNHLALTQEGKDLVTYALINAIAMRKILKKYDKVMFVCLSSKLMLMNLAFCFYFLIFIWRTGSLLKARTGLQVTSPKYAH